MMRRLISLVTTLVIVVSSMDMLTPVGTLAAGPPECGASADLVSGSIRQKWDALAPNGVHLLGCPLTEERDTPTGGGRYNDFEHGQIVWSPDQRMVVAAYNTATSNGVVVAWDVTDHYHYDYFIVAWGLDNKPITGMQKIHSNPTNGTYTIGPSVDPGRYFIAVLGCDPAGGGEGHDCKQGGSLPVYVDVGSLDVAHKADGTTPLPPATTPAEAAKTFDDRARVAFLAGCRQSFGDKLDAGFAFVALSKLYIATHQGLIAADPPPGDCKSKAGDLVEEVNSALYNAKVNGSVGTSACGRDGDYDMALRGLMPIMYDYGSTLDARPEHNVYGHVLHDLLTERGGADQVLTHVHYCGVVSQEETENHVLMTETSRYLTNQLLFEDVARQYQPGTPQYEEARRLYDNDVNGMEDWMSVELQGFLQHDFHEYNARPYARLSAEALQNLADYADYRNPQGRVHLGAQMVLDYLAAKFAVSSNGLRRSAPFRRLAAPAGYTPLFGNQSDEETWRFVQLAGNTQLLDALRFGRADWASPDTMAYAAVGTYRVPDLILDLIMNKGNNTYFQVIHHEGVELYASAPDFLISAGGQWEDSEDRDRILDGSTDDTKVHPLPTTLMPSRGGVDRNEFVQIYGNAGLAEGQRTNTCVAPGFACGLNPFIPDAYLVNIPSDLQLCAEHPVGGVIKDKWDKLGGASGVLGCPLTDEADTTEGIGRSQRFERGEIVWSRAQNLVVAAFQRRGQTGFGLDWNITDQSNYNYDKFIVRWDKDGSNVDQVDVQSDDWTVDDPNATRRTGTWNVPMSGTGQYRIVIEGCDGGGLLSSSSCLQGWSSPINLDFPLTNSCARASGNWTFLNVAGRCAVYGGTPLVSGTSDGVSGPPPPCTSAGCGFYVAVYSARCPSQEYGVCNNRSLFGPPVDPGSFGFFEAAEPSGLSFDQFQAVTLQHNGGREYSPGGANVYTTVDGRTITFTPDHERNQWGILGMDPNPGIPADMGQWGLAQGDIINSDGHTGLVTITNPALRRRLVLDMRDPKHPTRTELDLDTCQPEFVPRAAIPGDVVCVTPQTRQQAVDDNRQAGARRNPAGGPYGTDTCLEGFVWREISPTDHVCVTSQTRQQAADDNRQAGDRVRWK